MSKKIQKKIEELLFEIYEKGFQQETTDLTAYYKKIEQSLNIADVVAMLPIFELPKVNRVELIDENGRSYVNWKSTNKTSISMQDDGKTLKVFIGNEPQH